MYEEITDTGLYSPPPSSCRGFVEAQNLESGIFSIPAAASNFCILVIRSSGKDWWKSPLLSVVTKKSHIDLCRNQIFSATGDLDELEEGEGREGMKMMGCRSRKATSADPGRSARCSSSSDRDWRSLPENITARNSCFRKSSTPSPWMSSSRFVGWW